MQTGRQVAQEKGGSSRRPVTNDHTQRAGSRQRSQTAIDGLHFDFRLFDYRRDMR